MAGHGGGSGAGSGGAGGMACGAGPQAPARHARLLTPRQYQNTVANLLQVVGDFAKDFGGGADAPLDELGIERRANAAAEIARQAAAMPGRWSPCDPSMTGIGAAACGQQIVDRIGRRAFRRSLSAGERSELVALFDAGLKDKDFATGVEWFLTGLLQSPDFLYQLARPATGETAGEVRPLAGHEIASRLSYFLWDSMPDDALADAAAANQLADAASLAPQVQRMVDDARFLRGVESFYATWLSADFGEVARDDAAFTSEVVGALRTSLLMSATELYAAAPKPSLTDLLSGHTYYLDSTLRGFYGLSGASTGFSPVALPGEGRHGIVTHPALMAMLARPAESFPIARGLFIRHKLLCQHFMAPAIQIPALPPVSASNSTRDRFEQHTRDPACAACHEQIDPPGFALESFDQVGRHRTMDGGKAVNTSGVMMSAGDLEGSFARGEELMERIAKSVTVRDCFAQQYLEHALSRTVGMEDECSLARLQKSFAASGDLEGLAQGIATAETFRFRLAEGNAGP